MRQYRFPALAALALTLILVGTAALLWAQSASAHLPERSAGSVAALPPGQNPAGAVTPTPTATPTCGPSGGTPGPWVVRTPYPFTEYGAGVVSDGSAVYVSGGNTINGSVHAELYRYDVATDTYTARAAAPDTHYLSTVVYGGNGKIYDIAGLSPATASNLTRIYDIAGNTWTSGAVLPASLYDAAGAYYNGQIYVMGGTSGPALNTLYIYDITANSWTTGAPLPQAEFAMASGVIGSTIYVAGGSTGSSAVNTLYIYDIPTNTWASGATLPTAANYPAGAVIGGKLWVLGGGNPFRQADQPQPAVAVRPDGSTGAAGGPGAAGGINSAPTSYNLTQIYDPVSNTWAAGPAMNQTRSFFNAATLGTVVVAVGGYDTGVGGSVNTTETNTTTGGSPCPTTTPAGATNTPTPTVTATPVCGGPTAWVVRSPVPYNARGIFTVSDGTYVYAGGGYDGTTVHADLLRYDPAAGSWTALAPSPTQHFLGPAVYAPATNKIYNPGGFDAGSTPTNLMRIYDIAANTWTTGAPMPTGLTDHAVMYDNGVVYVAGGYNGSGGVNTLYAYNIAGNSWTTLAPLPQALYLPGGAALNGKLYIAGGNNGSELNTLYIYDIAGNTWSTGPTLPLAVTAPGSTVLNGQVWIYGGGFPTTHNNTQIYDPVANTWSAGPPLNVARLWFYGATVGNTIVAPGGDSTPGIPINTNETLTVAACATPTGTAGATNTPTSTPTPTITATPTCGTGPSAWQTETPLATARTLAAGATVNNLFYVISGFGPSAPNPAVERFDPATNVWTTLSPIPTPISQARGAALGTRIYVAGGFNNSFGGQTSGMQIYDTVTGLWSQGAPLPSVRSGAGVAAANGKIYIIAGYGPGFNAVNTVYEYDPVANTYATRAPVPAAEGNIAVGVLGNLIYAVGGAASYLHYAYDPVANTWSTIAAGPTANHQSPGVFALGGELWVVGGTNGFSPYPANQQVQIYNPGTDTWRFGPAFNIPRYGASAAAVLNGRGYVAAGQDALSSAYLTSMESIAPASACGTPTPTPPPPTNTPTATGTPAPTFTPRPASPTPTAPPGTATLTAVPTISPCSIYFVDVQPPDPFFVYVRCLTCRALLSGYPCGGSGEPCPGLYFRPNNDATRGQIAKILSNAAGYNNPIPSTQQTFEDVLPGSTFSVYIERLAGRGFINGYPCGGPGEPCIAPGNRPYFRPNTTVTRGQLSKVDVLTAGFTETPTTQTFEDVPPGSTFYLPIERLAVRGLITGYPCGGPTEPCVGPGNRPYFRTYSNVTRAQTAKIVANSFFPNCQTPIQRP